REEHAHLRLERHEHAAERLIALRRVRVGAVAAHGLFLHAGGRHTKARSVEVAAPQEFPAGPAESVAGAPPRGDPPRPAQRRLPRGPRTRAAARALFCSSHRIEWASPTLATCATSSKSAIAPLPMPSPEVAAYRSSSAGSLPPNHVNASTMSSPCQH